METQSKSLRNIPSLDGLRAIAVLLVVFAHSRGTVGFPDFHQGRIGNMGTLGVTIFFVISGCLITGILSKEQRSTGDIDLKRFYVRRAWRIFPAFYFYLLVVGILTTVGVFDIPSRDFAFAVAYWTNFQPHTDWQLAHAWSLAVEEQFYLIWPLLLSACRPTAMRWCALMVVAIPLFRLLSFALWPNREPWKWFWCVADALAVGCLLTGYREKLWAHRTYRSIVSSPWFASAAWCGVLVLNYASGKRPASLFPTLMILLIAALIDRSIRFPPVFLNWKPLTLIGAMSYSIYLWQQIFINRSDAAWYATFPQNYVLTFLAAAVSYYLIEQPCLKFRDRQSNKSDVTQSLTAAA